MSKRKARPKKILAMDPGNKKSGFVVVRKNDDEPGGMELHQRGIMENREMRKALGDFLIDDYARLVIETPKPRGMPTSGEEMETMIHIGRFIQRWSSLGGRWSYVFRMDVKLHLCGSVRAKDANVSQALRDRFGSQKEKKCQTCKGKGWTGRAHDECEACDGSGWETPPGPLAGIVSHMYAALAVACYWVDEEKLQQNIINPNQNKRNPRPRRR